MKKIIGIILIVVAAATGVWNFSQVQSEVELSDLALANVEALAQSENGGPCKWRTGHSSLTGWIAICDSYGVGYTCSCGIINYY